MTTVNITGFTGNNNAWAGANRKGVVALSRMLEEMLTDAGFDPYYATEGCDRNIVYLLDLSSRNAAHALYALDVLDRDPLAIIALDDWQIKGCFGTMRSMLEKGFPRNHHTYTADQLKRYAHVMEQIVNGERTCLYPAFDTPYTDHTLLGIPGDYSVALDPSSYVPSPPEEYRRPPAQLLAVHASLAKKWSYLEKKRYSILNLREEPEAVVWTYYTKHRIVLVPPHYHQGSGWWRDRYNLAHTANAIIVEDEGGPFGPEFEVERKMVKPETVDKIFAKQAEVYRALTWPRDKVVQTLKELLT